MSDSEDQRTQQQKNNVLDTRRSSTTTKCTANDAKEGECTGCYKQWKKEGVRRTFSSADNNMDPFTNVFPREISDLQLTPIEEMLITPVIDVAIWRGFSDWRLSMMDVRKIVG